MRASGPSFWAKASPAPIRRPLLQLSLPWDSLAQPPAVLPPWYRIVAGGVRTLKSPSTHAVIPIQGAVVYSPTRCVRGGTKAVRVRVCIKPGPLCVAAGYAAMATFLSLIEPTLKAVKYICDAGKGMTENAHECRQLSEHAKLVLNLMKQQAKRSPGAKPAMGVGRLCE